MSTTLGYEDRRVELEQFVNRHYIAAFDLKPCRMLDAGSGDGFWADIFAGHGYSVVGIDRDPEALATARARPPAVPPLGGPTDGRNPLYIAVDLDNAEQLRAFADANPSPFDLIFARTLPHFYGETLDRGEALIRRLLTTPGLLADDGLLLLSVYTNQQGADADGQNHHPAVELVAAAARAGALAGRARSAHGYWQIGVHRS